ncbi:MAG: WYL domain-containing protein [Treponema sp.]|nr:WYL domain-containing protein [Treponema sp.]
MPCLPVCNPPFPSRRICIGSFHASVFRNILSSFPHYKQSIRERTWHKGQKVSENKDGSVYLSFETNQLSQTASWILSFAGGAKALDPPELIAQVHEAARRILEN